MKKALLLKALVRLLAGIVLIMVLIFLPAGTLAFVNGWVFIGLLLVPMLIAGVILAVKNPELLERRLNSKESQSEQKVVVMLSGLMFLSGFILAGLNYRFSWLIMPDWVMIIASVVFIISYVLYGKVLRENTYLSRTIEVQNDQKVIETGLYGIVRHPMYSVTILMFLSIPFILGSLISFLIFLIYPFIIVKRIKNEETVLKNELAGYEEYMQKVRYRLIPFLW